ncbi:hypothetical protein NB691_000539 [Xanthomonas sacchari]|nr:hypothetical protein [Xanthomonas sacchari]
MPSLAQPFGLRMGLPGHPWPGAGPLATQCVANERPALRRQAG